MATTTTVSRSESTHGRWASPTLPVSRGFEEFDDCGDLERGMSAGGTRGRGKDSLGDVAPFKPLIPPTPLPVAGEKIEHATLDAKAKGQVKTGEPFHLAKDVAAFANHLGGNLLIGIPESGGILQAPDPLSEREVEEFKAAYSKQVTQRCRPAPPIDFGKHSVAGGFVLAVVVPPYVGQVVGVKVDADKSKGGYGGEAFAFPVRVGADSGFLSPEQLPMLMLPEFRFAVVRTRPVDHVGDMRGSA